MLADGGRIEIHDPIEKSGERAYQAQGRRVAPHGLEFRRRMGTIPLGERAGLTHGEPDQVEELRRDVGIERIGIAQRGGGIAAFERNRDSVGVEGTVADAALGENVDRLGYQLVLLDTVPRSKRAGARAKSMARV